MWWLIKLSLQKLVYDLIQLYNQKWFCCSIVIHFCHNLFKLNWMFILMVCREDLSFCLYLTIVFIKLIVKCWWSYSQSNSGVEVHVSSYSETICWICQISWHFMLYSKFKFYGWIPGFQQCFFAPLLASVVPWRTFNICKNLKGVQKVFQITKMFFLLR